VTASDRIHMLIRRVLVTAAVALLCFVFAKASQAEAVCTFDPATHALQLSVTPDVSMTTLTAANDGTIAGSTIGDAGTADFDCGGATTSTVDSIGIAGSNDVLLDASQHAFAPGFTPEASGSSEIEIAVANGFNSVTYAPPLGQIAVLTAGKKGLAVNDDDDPDITYGNAAAVGFFGGSVENDVTTQGGFGTGAALPRKLGFAFYSWGPGSSVDNVVGHEGNDLIVETGARVANAYGEGGSDQMYGGQGDGPYLLDGGPGNDFLTGTTGSTDVVGGDGNDHIRLLNGAFGEGDAGNDFFDAFDGAPETILGGTGKDTADVDASDAVSDVEKVRVH
jgi:hypothetical protein